MGIKHPGFAGVQNKIAQNEGVSQASAAAILAAGSRKASPAAVQANPRLKRVSGVTAVGGFKPPKRKGK